MAGWRLLLRIALIIRLICINTTVVSGDEGGTEIATTQESNPISPSSDSINSWTETTAASFGSSGTTNNLPQADKINEQDSTPPPEVVRNGKSKLNILFTHEIPSMTQVIEMGLKLVQDRLASSAGGYEIGFVDTMLTSSTDPIRLVTQICQRVDKFRPDLVIDFTKFGIPSEAVKVITKALQIPTVSSSIGGPGDIREWRNLLPSEAKYLIQINPPEDFAFRAIRTLATELKLPNMAIFHNDDYEMFHHHRKLLEDIPTKHKMIKLGTTQRDILGQLAHLIASSFSTFVIAGSLEEIDRVLSAASSLAEHSESDLFDQAHSWYSLSMDTDIPSCSGCRGKVPIVHLKPELQRKQEHPKPVDVKDPRTAFNLNLIVDAIDAAGYLLSNGSWPEDRAVIPCVNYKLQKYPEIQLDLRAALETVHRRGAGESEPFYDLRGNGNNHAPMTLRLVWLRFDGASTPEQKIVGYWGPGVNGYELVLNGTSLDGHVAHLIYRVVTVVQPPFVYKRSNCSEVGLDSSKCYYGYSIDVLNELAKALHFSYTIFDVDKYGYMNPDLPHDWNGMVRLLQDQEVDIAVGALSLYPEREKVMDFTAPVYDLVGYQILMKKEKQITALFKFLTVLESDVWMCILGAFFFTSILMWVFDRWSPYSYQNNREKYEDDEEKREFTFRESLWFCLTSLTPQGGGEAPKNLSGRLVAATWWLFGFIIIASYTANLAAFLTVSRLEAPIESLDNLIKQYKVQYAPVQNSSAWFYFDRMANVEHLFYEVWKDMSLNDSLTEYERSAFAVWEYPVSDKYTKIWQSFLENKPPHDSSAAVKRVRSKDPTMNQDPSASDEIIEEFAWIAEATEIRYHAITNCMFRIVGDEFSMNPYAFGVQKGSPLKEKLSVEIRKLEHLRVFEKLKIRWWNKLPEIPKCGKYDDLADGISLQNIGGVFSVIVVGFSMTIIATLLEFWWYRRVNYAQDISETTSRISEKVYDAPPAFQPIAHTDFQTKYSDTT